MAFAQAVQADLTWEGQNLSGIGIHKGKGLPLHPINFDGVVSSFGAEPMPKHFGGWSLFLGSYNQYVEKDRLKDDRGNSIPGHYNIRTYSSLERIILVSPWEIPPGWTLYLELLIPLFYSRAEIGTGANRSITRVSPLGDLILGTGLLCPETIRTENLQVDMTLQLNISMPTANYDPEGGKPGANVWNTILGFNPQFYLKFFNLYGEIADFLIIPSTNSNIINPATGFKDSYRLGPTNEFNAKLYYRFSEKFKGGLDGYVDNQLSNDKMGGHKITNSKEVAFGIGPGAVLKGKSWSLDLGFLFDNRVKNRPEGNRAFAIFFYSF
jgi:hypothetical protein